MNYMYICINMYMYIHMIKAFQIVRTAHFAFSAGYGDSNWIRGQDR